jgi:hypothetical protein
MAAMPVDDMPPPESAWPKPNSDIDADSADRVYQAAYDDSSDARGWIKACLSVLAAEIDLSDYDPMSLDAVREMRTEAARRAARILRLDIEQTRSE